MWEFKLTSAKKINVPTLSGASSMVKKWLSWVGVQVVAQHLLSLNFRFCISGPFLSLIWSFIQAKHGCLSHRAEAFGFLSSTTWKQRVEGNTFKQQGVGGAFLLGLGVPTFERNMKRSHQQCVKIFMLVDKKTQKIHFWQAQTGLIWFWGTWSDRKCYRG